MLEGQPGATPLPEVEARLRRAVKDEELLEPGRLASWQEWLGGKLGCDPERVLVGAHPDSFPLRIPEGIEVALAWEPEQPLVTAAGPERARAMLNWSFTAALEGDVAATPPERLERLAVALLAGHLTGVLRELGWTLDPAVDRLLAPE